MITAFKRVFLVGFQNFWRNGWLSATTVSVMVLVLSMILGLLMISVLTEAVVQHLENQIDISVYFKPKTAEPDILQVKNNLLAEKEVKSVEYVSEDAALALFKERHKADTIIAQVLEELDANPLEASLNIKAKAPDQFAAIAKFLEKKEYAPLISAVNYYENQETIARLSSVISAIRKTGLFITLALSVISVLVALNTIRIAIYTLKDEVTIMKLVGATNWFIRGPFLVEGVLYGLISATATIIVFYPIMFLLAPYVDNFFPGSDLFLYFQRNFMTLWLILLLCGIVLGVFGSMIAIRKYLKI
ncbi:hypothetical protein A3C91_00980 [Candidatus Azambacteria bacterium RIFCSPHIGHO2_02_FULL_52_12]|uniref:Cell division protein FtsX n=1 Tax=Candidatus Azambacteria bacterium RIFCSPLOWO2_01_FULL_46_25 TaxID=1797298 RepID=A0A1F5BU37_9BACT|nr:MAG: hypothetical protein A3C91_00980 [Candidatus Azambacteria bacterium RIFCSPHIGHO2_02_FULL_52_12]OGD34095.1 MAG: hypothetical protein A2988_01260 [Candidatus Azambacteria bacterium RIFCSPLOWO2_01_FULL_46_25]OGD36694.1 MAG: hypothetical protein A2850_00215 [Candidatus Azambacteria bacterium RIFCSPHIGHO2_01_FULL_51_74]